ASRGSIRVVLFPARRYDRGGRPNLTVYKRGIRTSELLRLFCVAPTRTDPCNELNKTEHEPTSGRSTGCESGRLTPTFRSRERTFSRLFPRTRTDALRLTIRGVRLRVD